MSRFLIFIVTTIISNFSFATYGWTESTSVDKMTDKKTKLIGVDSKTLTHNNENANLYFVCKPNGNFVISSSDMFSSSNEAGGLSIEYRVDKLKKSEIWGYTSSDSKRVIIGSDEGAKYKIGRAHV